MDDQIGVQLVSILSPGESFYLLSTRYTCDLKYRPRLPVIVIVIGIGTGTGTETDIVTVTVKENGNDHVVSLLLGRRGEMNVRTNHLLNLPQQVWRGVNLRTKVIRLLSDMFLALEELCNMSIWIPYSESR